ncbi:DNA-deoxyinosine glycosylase [Oscillospiraceae bacterium OttesenSCG-928-G22]|nr:DNA-deoxyinosine glycosylase [Oscillospiraceae bacterium OttesenSCG-928-G22]
MIQSFPPIAAPDATALILGTMPSVRSLAEHQYYAHPQNAFWKIVELLFSERTGLSYDERCGLLLSHRIALWDVLAACEREGSSDSDIRDARPNDFASLFAEHPSISVVCFNGQKAASLFDRLVRKRGALPELRYMTLSSTSPAHTMSFSEKLARWQSICEVTE